MSKVGIRDATKGFKEMKMYFQSKNTNIAKVMVIYKGNEYHEWAVRDIVREKGLKIVRKNYTETNIKKLKYSSLFDEDELIWFEVDEVKKMKSYLSEIKLGKKYIVFEITKPIQEKLLKGIAIDGHIPKVLPKADDWEAKMKQCAMIVNSINAKFDKEMTKKQLIQMMVTSPEEWKDIELSLLVAKENNTKIDMDYLNNLFPDMEFYRLDEWIQMVLEGKKKKKTLYIAEYFIRVKGYNPVWLMQKVREKFLDLGLVYEAYRKGVIYKLMETPTKIVERSKAVGWSRGEDLSMMKAKDLVWCLYGIQKIPYNHYVKVESILFDGKEFVTTRQDLYRYIEEIREAREGLGEKNEYTRRK